MIYVYLEYHTDDLTGEQIVCDETFSFFRKHACFRKLGQQHGFPIKGSTSRTGDQEDHETLVQHSGGIDLGGEKIGGNVLAESLPIYVGPPQRRLADKWQVFGYIRTLEYGPKESAALADFNPVFPEYIVKRVRVEDAVPALYQLDKRNPSKSCEIIPPIAILRHTDADVECIGTCHKWRHDGEVLCVGYASGYIAVWSKMGGLLYSEKVSNAVITAIAFSGNKAYWNHPEKGKMHCNIAVGDASGNVTIYRMEDGLHQLGVHEQKSVITDIDWQDSVVFAAASADAKVVIYDTIKASTVTILDHFESNPVFMEWCASGKCLAILDNTSLLKLYKPYGQNAQGTVTSLSAHTKNIVAASWQFGHNPKSANKICTVGMDKQLLVWDVVAECVVTSIILDKVPTTIAVNSTDTFVAVGTYGNLVKILNLPTLSLSCSFCDQDLPTSITWSSDGEYIAYNVYNKQRTSIIPILTSPTLSTE
uniref:WD domain, G-beta repeat containing protein n=1 Tax=Babesia bovis TaxID=5865 RepID=A7ANC9_BABBO|eukprot:XP_001611631.1 WD domain, G-beta repeat containing protein [Babesia bovis T2Bo]